eukprot:5185331-Pyramimonas_sp.AAC.1
MASEAAAAAARPVASPSRAPSLGSVGGISDGSAGSGAAARPADATTAAAILYGNDPTISIVDLVGENDGAVRLESCLSLYSCATQTTVPRFTGEDRSI